MFQAGQLSGTRFTLERVSFNDVLAAHLIDSLRRLMQLPPEHGAAGDDDSDDGQ